MPDLNNIKKIYFLGIGGIGMSALARYFRHQGVEVSGYDKVPTALTDALQKEGIPVHFDDNINLIPKDYDLAVYTPAIPQENNEFIFLKNQGNLYKRAEILGKITERAFTIAVAGTHGKTTITSMITHILKTAGMDLCAFIGGISKNFNSNLVLSKENSIAVVEADEFDRSFLQLHPDIAVISAMDADHLDIYGDANYMVESYHLFANQIKHGGKLILKNGLRLENLDAPVISYSSSMVADFSASDIAIKNGSYYFTICGPEGLRMEIEAGVPGMHNVENATAATAVAVQLGVGKAVIQQALRSYTGVRRRFDYRIKAKEIVYIDDYAHHPEEIRACLKAVKELYPEKRITGVFQPHLYTRTRDLAEGFIEVLSVLDDLILMDIYPARELPIPGVSSEIILKKVMAKNKMISSKQDLVAKLINLNPEVIITMGAGDIDQMVDPIEEAFKKYHHV